MIESYVRAYVDQVRRYARAEDDGWALTLDTATGHVRDVLIEALSSTRVALLEKLTVVEEHRRRMRRGPGVRELDDAERALVEEAVDAVIGPDESDFVAAMVAFGHGYAAVVREDHRLFVDAFREGLIPGLRSSAPAGAE